eukprot:tig00000113_g5653.t1
MFKSFSFGKSSAKEKEAEAQRALKAQRKLVANDLHQDEPPGLEDLLEDALLEATPESPMGIIQTLEVATQHDERQTLELFSTVIHNSSVLRPPPGTKDVQPGTRPDSERIIVAFREVLHGFMTEEQPDVDLDHPGPVFNRVMEIFRAALQQEEAHLQRIGLEDVELLREESEERDSVGAHDENFDQSSAFFLHRAVWFNDERALGEILFNPEPDRPPNVNEYDLRGNTPLHLAVRLGNAAAVRLLIDHGADPKKKNAHGWTVLDEAVATGDQDVVTAVYVGMQRAAWQKWCERKEYIMAALEKLPDFYMELKWEFESGFMPFVNAMAPSDVYRIWKKRSSVRIDTTLVGFDNFKAVRGSLSILFMGSNSDCPGDVFIVDREERTILDALQKLRDPSPDEVVDEVEAIMRADLMQGRLNAKDLAFEPAKTLLGNPKVEAVGRWRNTRVYEAGGTFTVKILRRKVDVKWLDAKRKAEEAERKRRDMEILKENERRDRMLRGMPPLEENEQAIGSTKWKRYPFKKNEEPAETDIATRKAAADALRRRKALEAVEKRRAAAAARTTTAGGVKATVWLSEEFDISVPDIIPVIDIIASTAPNKYMGKLKDLMALKFPEGLFPVRISVPLMLSVSATITFQRFERVSNIADEVFLVPPDYRARVPGSAEDQMLQHLKTLQTKTEGQQAVGKGFDWMHR